ncbi:hypothetical protein [Nocardia asteroides]|uniref:hypothetical protein n=1 Tax=Nocardia asteroides TaxID=1824 RepID=UPI00343B0287
MTDTEAAAVDTAGLLTTESSVPEAEHRELFGIDAAVQLDVVAALRAVDRRRTGLSL